MAPRYEHPTLFLQTFDSLLSHVHNLASLLNTHFGAAMQKPENLPGNTGRGTTQQLGFQEGGSKRRFGWSADESLWIKKIFGSINKSIHCML